MVQYCLFGHLWMGSGSYNCLYKWIRYHKILCFHSVSRDRSLLAVSPNSNHFVCTAHLIDVLFLNYNWALDLYLHAPHVFLFFISLHVIYMAFSMLMIEIFTCRTRNGTWLGKPSTVSRLVFGRIASKAISYFHHIFKFFRIFSLQKITLFPQCRIITVTSISE